MRLVDLHAKFVSEISADGSCWKHGLVSAVAQAQGVQMECPCGEGHHIIVPFAGRSVPANYGPRDSKGAAERPRWIASGTTLDDLTVTPSIAVGGGETPECWHGFITAGEVRTC